MAAQLISLAAVILATFTTSAASQGTQPSRLAQTPPAITQLQGGWDFLSQDGSRRCRITLRNVEAKGGRALGFPATCRRALPILTRVAAWSVSDDGLIRLNDADGRTLFAFEEDAQAFRLKARGPDGAEYKIDSLGRTRRFVSRTAAAPPPPRVPFDPARAPARETIPGLYGVARYGGQEVCRINLGTQPGSSDDRFLASYPQRCRDQGLAVFDAVAWRYTGGRLHLIARRGHEIILVSTGQGEWRKDPPGGSELFLKRLN
jgi:hypothetical protein